MFTINFKFIIDQEILTSFGEKGIITMLGFDDGGKNIMSKLNQMRNGLKRKN